jgi:polygalacturonase
VNVTIRADAAQSSIGRRTFLTGGVAALALPACASGARPALRGADPFAPMQAIIAAIAPAQIGPERVDLSHPRDGISAPEDSRPIIQSAIDRMHAAGGGTVALGAGNWLSDGPIRLKSGVCLHLDEGAHLRFSGNPDSYLPPVLTRWEGTEAYTYSPMLFADGQSDIAITGKGVMDGQGKANFLPWRSDQNPIKAILRDMGRDGVPVGQRIFVGERRLRPHFVQFRRCQRVLIDGPTFIDSPFWMIHPLYCEDVIIRNITCISRHINSDGIDPDSSRRVLIEDCDFDVGDDGVSIKSGRDQDGWRVGLPSEDIVIRNCRYSGDTGGGVAIGSEMSGGVRRVYVDGFDLPKASHTLYFKANLDRGGMIEEIFIRRIRAGEVKSVLVFSNAYHSYRGGNFPPVFRNVLVDDVVVEKAMIGISVQGHPSAPVTNVRIAAMTIGSAQYPLTISDSENVALSSVTANGRAVTLADAIPVDADLVGH